MTRIAFLMALGTIVNVTQAAGEVKLDDLQLRGMSIHFESVNQTLEFEPLQTREFTATGSLQVVKPTWRNGYRLPRVAWTYAALTRGSIRASTVTEPVIDLREGTDFVVNNQWGTIGAVQGSRVAPGTELRFRFSYTSSRLDLVEQKADGTLVVKKGVPDMNAPELPQPSDGCRPLLGVYLSHNTTALTAENINVISDPGPLTPPVRNADAVRRILSRVQAGKPATIVFLGDSITAQSDVKGGSFVDRFAGYLRKRFESHRVTVKSPKDVAAPRDREIVVVKAGVGGNNSSQGLARFETDVLRHDPQIVIVMFGANDENKRPNGETAVSLQHYRKNLASMVAKAQAAGAEPILLTPAMKNLDWVATTGVMDRFAEMVREVADDAGVCCVDVHDAWQRIPTVGSNYMVYLNSSINHPNHLGHELFARGLRRAVSGR